MIEFSPETAAGGFVSQRARRKFVRVPIFRSCAWRGRQFPQKPGLATVLVGDFPQNYIEIRDP